MPLNEVEPVTVAAEAEPANVVAMRMYRAVGGLLHNCVSHESPGRRSGMLPLRPAAWNLNSAAAATPRSPFCYALPPRERESLESSTMPVASATWPARVGK